MASRKNPSTRNDSSKAALAAKAGAGAASFGILTWLVGDLSWQNAAEWGKTLLIAGVLALCIRWSLGEPFKIPSGSMETTLHGDARIGMGDRVWVNKWIYGLRVPFMNKRIWRGQEPQRWDVVVFKAVEKQAEHGTLVKRIAGMPGEKVLIRDGKINIWKNDKWEVLAFPDSMPKDMNYTKDGKYGVIDVDAFTQIPPDHYLVLGDNSARSKDGRYWGWVPNENILGRVFCIWWPPARWRDFTGFTATWWWRSILTLLGVFVVWRLLLGRSWRIHGDSPDDALKTGEHIFINRCRFGVPIPFTRKGRFTKGRPPARGELVLFWAALGEGGEDSFSMGRVVGLPGEKTTLEEGRLLVDGKPVEGVFSDRRYGDGASGSVRMGATPEGHVVILAQGEDHADSRELGPVPVDSIIGRVACVWWPLWRIRRVR